jgi:hypothetical protein
VPEFVSAVDPPSAEGPPAEFQRLSEELVILIETTDDGWSKCEERREISIAMIQIYQSVRMVKEDPKISSRRRFLERREDLRRMPDNDHCWIFRNDHGLIWTSQPYGYDAAAVVGFAHYHGLSVTISPKWSWWFPGKTTLIEWRKAYVDFSVN